MNKEQWISIKDRLPENEQVVITAHDERVGRDFKVQMHWFDAQNNTFKSWKMGKLDLERDDGTFNDTVTHWIPLPESPEQPMTNSDGDIIDNSAWLCIKDVVMESDGIIAFTKGRYYYSAEEGCLTNNQGNTAHFVSNDDEGDFRDEHFKKIKRG